MVIIQRICELVQLVSNYVQRLGNNNFELVYTKSQFTSAASGGVQRK